MASVAFRLSKWTLDTAPKLIKADVRVHNLEAIKDDMAVVFAVGQHTRLEALLLLYVLQKHLGKEVAALAEDGLFTGRIGGFLRTTASIATADPDRDSLVLHSLLQGNQPWVVFPEESRRHEADLGHQLEGNDAGPGPLAAPLLALRAEICRHRLGSLAEKAQPEEMTAALGRFGLETTEPTLGKRTVIVPVNVTYYPLRAYENVFLRLGRVVAKDLGKRGIESASVDGTVLGKDVDVCVALGSPIDVRHFLDAPEHRSVLGCSMEEFDASQQDPGSTLCEAARSLALRVLRDMGRLTAINLEHVLAELIRYQWGQRVSERALRYRAFLAARSVRQMHTGAMHRTLNELPRDLLDEKASPQVSGFLGRCVQEGVLTREADGYRRAGESHAKTVRDRDISGDFFDNLAAIFERMPDISRRVKWIARTPAWYNAYRVRALLVEEDHREFDHDYTAHYEPGVTKGTEVGRPFLLKPLCAKGAVVLIHGYMAAPLETRAMAEHLRAQGYAVYGVRLKGHGTSPADLAATTWEDWRESIDHAYAVMRTISDRVIVGGFSMGAGLALLTAARTPETTRAVFAISAPLHLRSSAARYAPSIVKVNTLLRRFRWGRSYQWEYVENRPENPHINYLVNPVAGVAELTEAMEVMQEALKDLRVPTLILQGSRDPVVNPNSGSAIFERIATEHKELLVLERDRHGIINGPGTAEVFARVCAFLEWALQTAGDNAKPTGTVEAAPQSDYTSTGNFVAK